MKMPNVRTFHSFPMLWLVITTVTLVGQSALAVDTQSEPAPRATVKWDMASLFKVVEPMRHALGKQDYLTVWSLPLPKGDKLAEMRASGELQRDLKQLAQRGLVPTVDMGWRWTPKGAIAMAKTLQEMHLPVQVLIPTQFKHVRMDIYKWPSEREDVSFWAKAKVRIPNPAERLRKRWPTVPALPQYDTTAAANYVTKCLKVLKNEDIKVDTAFFDYEGKPYPWNGTYAAQKDPRIRKTYKDPSVLDTFQTFYRYTLELRALLLSQALAQPVHELYPQARVGNYNEVVSSQAVPYVTYTGAVYPPAELGKGLTLVMPSLYANANQLPKHFNADWPVTQCRIDAIFFNTLFQAGSTAAANVHGELIYYPYVSPNIPMGKDRFKGKHMSGPAFRELLRHLWLRGADNMYIFNNGIPGPQWTAQQSFQCIENVRSVLDEMLAFPEFLEHGEPMNFDVPAMFSHAAIWSGLRLKDRFLIRATSLGTTTQKVEVVLDPNKTISLTAPPQGATYLVQDGGSKVRNVSEKVVETGQ